MLKWHRRDDGRDLGGIVGEMMGEIWEGWRER